MLHTRIFRVQTITSPSKLIGECLD